MGIIYMATCRMGHKSYIGQTIQSLELRRRAHESTARRNPWDKGSSTAFALAIKKYGPEQFDWQILEECDASELNDREIAAIAEHKTLAPEGYNIHPGGVGIEIHKRHRRKNETDSGLPQHIVRYTHKTGSGYRVMMPDGRRKAFMSKYYSDEEKLAMAKEWCEKALSDPEYKRTAYLRKNADDNDLPAGMIRYRPKDRKGEIYTIVTENADGSRATQSFTSRDAAFTTYDAMIALISLKGLLKESSPDIVPVLAGFGLSTPDTK